MNVIHSRASATLPAGAKEESARSFSLNLYKEPPVQTELTLDQFEDYALARLKV